MKWKIALDMIFIHLKNSKELQEELSVFGSAPFLIADWLL